MNLLQFVRVIFCKESSLFYSRLLDTLKPLNFESWSDTRPHYLIFPSCIQKRLFVRIHKHFKEKIKPLRTNELYKKIFLRLLGKAIFLFLLLKWNGLVSRVKFIWDTLLWKIELLPQFLGSHSGRLINGCINFFKKGGDDNVIQTGWRECGSFKKCVLHSSLHPKTLI